MYDKFKQFARSKAMMVYVIVVLAFAVCAPAFAQTPVPLEVPVNDIFVQANAWMVTFGPIIAIGVGIAIALAILTFVGNKILAAFSNKAK